MREKFARFFMGRYGYDKLTLFAVIVSVILSAAAIFVGNAVVYYILRALSIALLVLVVLRMFSRNISARKAENEKYLRIKNKILMSGGGIKKHFTLQKNKWRDRKTHRYFRCPGCKNILRVPRGKGEITVTCPVCGAHIDAKV